MKILEKLSNIRSNNTVTTPVANGAEFYDLFSDYLSNSKLLDKSVIVKGIVGSNYYFTIEDGSSNISLLGNESLKPTINLSKTFISTPKTLGVEVKINKNYITRSFINNYISEEDEEKIVRNFLYKPFLKAIEKNIISGNYFDKSLFSTNNTISGTNDFDGLLKLTRALKDKSDNNCIVGHSSVISNIIDTITKEAYLNEYLLNKTIEGVPIIETVEAPQNENGNILVGYDPTKICLLLSTELEVKKFSTLEDGMNTYFQLYIFVNGGDIFDSSVGLTVVV